MENGTDFQADANNGPSEGVFPRLRRSFSDYGSGATIAVCTGTPFGLVAHKVIDTLAENSTVSVVGGVVIGLGVAYKAFQFASYGRAYLEQIKKQASLNGPS